MGLDNLRPAFLESRSAVIGLAIGLLVVLGAVDYYTGHELSFSVFYLAPITLVTWYINKRAGLLMAVVSAVVWTLIDLFAGESYAHSLILYWNTLTRFAFYAVVLLLIAQLKDKYELAERLSLTDPLTNIANRRRFFVMAELVLERARRNHTPTTVADVDLDDFKGINDHYSHHVGDEVLRLVAQTMQTNARHADVVESRALPKLMQTEAMLGEFEELLDEPSLPP